ncbi:hypothetical protein PAUR_a0181 [Pseudoalteromonas aurantia 208]|uniref:Uncharacterized protein n=1 Tax=Pseudoalteromonas aurantia 208 TaxID=1314867 RepID=A0ABR9EAV8_9GAMM|nr:hypothetical protein [Pseudoalteromonas aurantia 208]
MQLKDWKSTYCIQYLMLLGAIQPTSKLEILSAFNFKY